MSYFVNVITLKFSSTFCIGFISSEIFVVRVEDICLLFSPFLRFSSIEVEKKTRVNSFPYRITVSSVFLLSHMYSLHAETVVFKT